MGDGPTSRQRMKRQRPKKSRRRRSPSPRRSATPAPTDGYDPRVAPAPARWLALAPQERWARVRSYHEALPPGRRPPSLDVHAGLHVTVETQLASADPPQALAALRRLMAAGLRRHDAVHAIGWLAAEHWRRAVDEERSVDVEAYAAELDSLTRESWLAAAGAAASAKSLSAPRGSD